MIAVVFRISELHECDVAAIGSCPIHMTAGNIRKELLCGIPKIVIHSRTIQHRFVQTSKGDFQMVHQIYVWMKVVWSAILSAVTAQKPQAITHLNQNQLTCTSAIKVVGWNCNT